MFRTGHIKLLFFVIAIIILVYFLSRSFKEPMHNEGSHSYDNEHPQSTDDYQLYDAGIEPMKNHW